MHKMSYYREKITSLKDIFGADEVRVTRNGINVDGRRYPVIDDVIILLEPAQYPTCVKTKLGADHDETTVEAPFAEDIQYTFGEEWKTFSSMLPEHEKEFSQYFDLLDLDAFTAGRVCDLGCGMGRWSYFLRERCRELVLVDFSEAIFVARENLRDAPNALFFMGDITHLPFRGNFADLAFCLGVLHTLPVNALDQVRVLGNHAPLLLIYLYYALDNRPLHFRLLLSMVTMARKLLSRVRSHQLRASFTWLAALCVYFPLITLGRILGPLNLARYIPLYEGYEGKSLGRIRQDVYDRFFTRIEQRFSRQEILQLRNRFSEVTVSDGLPYWHFVCRR